MPNYPAIQIILEAHDRARAAFRSMQESMRRLRSQTSRLGSSFAVLRREAAASMKPLMGLYSAMRKLLSLKTVIVGALGGYAIKSIGEAFVGVGNQLETFESQLTAVMDRNRQAAQEALQQIREFAAWTPHMTDDVVEAYVLLRSTIGRITMEQIETIGDVAYVFNRRMRDVAAGLISMETEVLRRLGVIVDRTGKEAILKSGDIVLHVKNDIETIRQALFDLFKVRFGGAMKAAVQDWRGMTALLASYWWEFRAKVMKAGVFQFIKSRFKLVVDFLDEAAKTGKLDEWARVLADAIVRVMRFFEKVGVQIINFIAAIARQTILFKSAVLSITASMAKLYGIYARIRGIFSRHKDDWKALQNEMQNTYQQALTDIAKLQEELAKPLPGMKIAEALKEAEKELKRIQQETADRVPKVSQQAVKKTAQMTKQAVQEISWEMERLQEQYERDLTQVWQKQEEQITIASERIPSRWEMMLSKIRDINRQIGGEIRTQFEFYLGEGLYEIAKGRWDNLKRVWIDFLDSLLRAFTDMLAKMMVAQVTAQAAGLWSWFTGLLPAGGAVAGGAPVAGGATAGAIAQPTGMLARALPQQAPAEIHIYNVADPTAISKIAFETVKANRTEIVNMIFSELAKNNLLGA